MENEYIYVIYKNDAIDICEENNYKYISANEDIDFGELLLIEHVLTVSRLDCHYIINNNQYLFDTYHPRGIKFKEVTNEDKGLITKTKISHNCFSFSEDKDKLIMSDKIARFNHSCEPNASVYVQRKYKNVGLDTVFMEVYAVRHIDANDEITISYGPETAHRRDFECKCGKGLNERVKIFSVISKIAQILSDQDGETIKKKIYEYLETPISKKILLNQFLSSRGIFMNGDTICAYTDQGEELINKMLYSNLGIDLNIFGDDKLKESKKMNQTKLNMFLEILNCNILKKEANNN